MRREIKTEYGIVEVGNNAVDNRFGADKVVVKGAPDLMGLSKTEAVQLTAALVAAIARAK